MLAGLFAVGCTASAEEVRPPNGSDPTGDSPIFFPTGAAVSDNHLFVANANSELRYDSGSIAVFPIGQIRTTVDAWTDPARREVPAGCAQDGDRVETLNCEAFNFISPQAGARVGNFVTDIAVQEIGAMGSRERRLIVPTRGDPSIAWVDWDGERLSCTTGSEPFALCDDAHRLSFVLNDADLLSIPDEPFGAYADTAGQFAIVTHLTSGAVTLIDSPRDGSAQITDITIAFQPDPSTGLRGATGVTGHDGMIYVGSRSEDRVQMFTVGRPVNGAPPFLLMGNWFFLDAVGSNTGGSSDTRGMTFSSSGDRLYLVNRRPPSLQVFDTSIGPTGFPKNQPIGAVDICRQASTLVVAGDTIDEERVYVSCFQDGQLYIIDPRGDAQTEDVVTVGRGPYAVAVAHTEKLLFVTNFLEDTIAVIDIKSDSPTRNRVVLRIGKPRGQA